MKKLGYGEITKFIYFIPGMDKKNGIRYVMKFSDNDILEMMKWDDNGDIHIYVECVTVTVFEGENNTSQDCLQKRPNISINENDVISHNFSVEHEMNSLNSNESDENSIEYVPIGSDNQDEDEDTEMDGSNKSEDGDYKKMNLPEEGD